MQVGGVHSGTVTGINLPPPAGGKGPGRDGPDEVDARDYQAGFAGIDRDRGLLGNQYLAISFGSVGQPT